MDDLMGRIIKAVLLGLIAGIVTALLVFIISALVPGMRIDASFWGLVVGIIVGLYSLFNDRPNQI